MNALKIKSSNTKTLTKTKIRNENVISLNNINYFVVCIAKLII